MNLSYLKSYLETVKRGGFSDAGKALGLSQPTISFHIQRLEEELSAKLLERKGGRVTLTQAGEEFQSFAEKVLRDRQVLGAKLEALQSEVTGRLSLGASTNPGEYILPRILGDFRKSYPKASATVVIADTAEIVEKILDRQCDAGFIGADVEKRGLKTQKIAEDELLLLAPPDHPLAQKGSISLGALENQNFIVREDGSGTQKTVEGLMQANGLNPKSLREILVAGSNQAVVTAVEAGIGLAFASQIAAARSLKLGSVKSVRLQGKHWVRGIYFVRPSRTLETKLMREFVSFVENWRIS